MRLSVGLMLLASLSGCSFATSGPVPNEFCQVAKPIYFDPADRMTERTELAIIAHNEKGAALCGWQGAK